MELHHSPEYRTVAVFATVPEAELARGLLEADGIAAAILDALDAALFPGVVHGVRLQVPSADAQRARDLLDLDERRHGDGEDGDVPNLPPRSAAWTATWIALAVAVGAVGIAVLL